MVRIEIDYEGQLRCNARHVPSGNMLSTDAPVDNQGRGESFSPTDLVATAYASCMATIMGIAAQQREVDLKGMSLSIEKHMAADLPRRISRLVLEIEMPIAEEHPDARVIKDAGLNCPVRHSVHPEIEVEITWKWS